MRTLLCCAASAAALIFVASAADTAAPKTKTPATAVQKTGSTKAAPKTAAKAPVTKSAAATKTKTGTAKSAAKTAHSATTTHSAAAKTGMSTTTHRTVTASVPRRPVSSWRNRQAAPTPDRYREIQAALITKGYLQPDDATGKWDETSIEAMKRFQAEQNLDSTGKINSLSLIALGLGPKYEAAPPKPGESPNGQ